MFDVTTEKDKDGNEVTTYTVNDIDEQIKKMRDYHNDIKKLKEDGASYGLLDELNSLGTDEAVIFADKIAKMSDTERKEIIDLWILRPINHIPIWNVRTPYCRNPVYCCR